MEKDIILKADKISKQYKLGLVGTGSINDDLKRWWYKIRGKENPFLKIGESNDRSTKGSSDYVWALQDINFEVERGEVVGIIGKNGAGKSTLLKILSKVTSPTTGEIKTKGRIASLLEVGTGFHGEMTGRENIYLNGAILGMTKKEIASKIDEIIDFSGCQRYIDTPVKRYSSGMTVRLAFAVAAFLEPEILVIDEVLAVGDAEFQKKAIGKMQDISKGEGRTVLFVSHNMAAVKQLCTRGIVLEHGKTVFEGGVHDAVDFYLYSNQYSGYKKVYSNELLVSSGVMSAKLLDSKEINKAEFKFDESIFVSITLKIESKAISSTLGFRVINSKNTIVFTTETHLNNHIQTEGVYTFLVEMPSKTLVPDNFKITIGLHKPNIQMIELLEEFLTFEIVETGSDLYVYQNVDYGCVFVDCKWKFLNG